MKKKWINSEQARKLLKVSTCDLAHLRDEHHIESKKEGNKYFYLISANNKGKRNLKKG